jgi:GR25 family glycosyltransferase involved in LPS biosynthesis
MNSILNCFEDIEKIDYWLCVDDNSSEEDRQKMKELYPFFTFYFKTLAEKGHPQSMNIIRNKVTTPYLLHLEDDWKFFEKKCYIEECMDVLSSNASIGQCLINKNYAEISRDVDVKGGIFHTTHQGVRYYVHEYCRNAEELQQWIRKYGDGKSSNYWPHFSFRPSIMKTRIIKDLGEFDVTKSHFEMDYAYRYINKGLISAFLEGIHCLHIGRLTSERDDLTKLNAYALNDECQFAGKEEQVIKQQQLAPPVEEVKQGAVNRIKSFVVNLDTRQDRWEKFERDNAPDLKFLKYQRFSAVDGKKLVSTCQLQQIFENNDYQMRRGMVGCFMSHVKLYCDLIYDNTADGYLILEDDIELTSDFESKYNALLAQLSKENNWAFCFLGHHVRDVSTLETAHDKTKIPVIEKVNVYRSFILSLGGTTGYLISKSGAKAFLDFLDSTGATNGIDTCIQKSADILGVYYPTPHLIYSDCFRGDHKVDSDIQYDYSGLEKSVEERVQDEVKFFQDKAKVLIHIYEYNNIFKYITKKDITHACYYKDDDQEKIKTIQNTTIHPYYMIGSSCIFVVPQKMPRYFHRYKNDEKYSVEDCFEK